MDAESRCFTWIDEPAPLLDDANDRARPILSHLALVPWALRAVSGHRVAASIE